jgi:hypothetical protein
VNPLLSLLVSLMDRCHGQVAAILPGRTISGDGHEDGATPAVTLAPSLRFAESALKIASELSSLSGENSQVVAGQLAPPLLHFALNLPPSSRNLVPMHGPPL